MAERRNKTERKGGSRRSDAAAAQQHGPNGVRGSVVGDVNVNGDGATGAIAIHAASGDVGAGAGVIVAIENFVQRDGVGEGGSGNERHDHGLAGGEVRGGGVTVQVEVVATNRGRECGHRGRANGR